MSLPPINSCHSVQSDVQSDVQCDVQSEVANRHVFEEELVDDWRNPLNDQPIPFRLVHDVERGSALDDIDPRGFVP